jgi:putative flippase GtrA
LGKKILHEVFSFASIGIVGFAIEAIVLSILVAQGLDIYLSRAMSFPTALTATWYLNRKHTFDHGKNSRFASLKSEYIGYFLIQVVGALLNLAVFSLVVYLFPQFKLIPVIPLAIGAGIAMVFNYSASKYFVYGKQVKVADGIQRNR